MKLFYFVKKAGKLANGWERGKGTIIHVVEADPEHHLIMQEALCGAQPKIQWTEVDSPKDLCPKCAKKLEAEDLD